MAVLETPPEAAPPGERICLHVQAPFTCAGCVPATPC